MIKLAEPTVRDDDGPGGGFDVGAAIGLSTARTMLRGRGSLARPPSVESVRRWVLVGCPCGPHRTMVKLQARRLNGEYLTMESWVREFEAERLRLSAIEPLCGERTNRTRLADQRRANRELNAARIGTPRT